MVYTTLSKYFHRRNDEHDIGKYFRTNCSTMVLTRSQMLKLRNSAQPHQKNNDAVQQ